MFLYRGLKFPDAFVHSKSSGRTDLYRLHRDHPLFHFRRVKFLSTPNDFFFIYFPPFSCPVKRCYLLVTRHRIVQVAAEIEV